MKKFGTPIAAAPGSASEKVGSEAVGAPAAASAWACASRLAFLASAFASAAARRRAAARALALARSAALAACCSTWPPWGTSVGLAALPCPSCGVEAWPGCAVAAGAWAGVVAEGCVAVGAGVCAGAEAGPTSVALTIAPGTTSASVLPSGTVTRRTWPEGSCTSKTRSADAGSTVPPKPARRTPADDRPMSSLRFFMLGCSPLLLRDRRGTLSRSARTNLARPPRVARRRFCPRGTRCNGGRCLGDGRAWRRGPSDQDRRERGRA